MSDVTNTEFLPKVTIGSQDRIDLKNFERIGRCSRTVISETIEKVFPSVVDFKDVVLKKLPLEQQNDNYQYNRKKGLSQKHPIGSMDRVWKTRILPLKENTHPQP